MSAMSSRRVRVIHITECLSGRTLAVLQRTVTELDALGVSQSLIYSRRADTPARVADLFDPALELRELAPAKGSHWAFIGALRAQIGSIDRRRERVVVHLHSSKAGFIGRLLMAVKQPLVRCLYSPHGMACFSPSRRLGRPLYWGLERLAGRLPFEAVGDLVDEVDVLERLSGRKAHLLELAVGEEFFGVARSESPRPLVIARGAVRAWRDPEAFGQLSIASVVSDIDADFTWIGAGDKKREARLKASSVNLTGELSDTEVAGMFAHAWVFVQLSRQDDSPLSLYQAMAAGLPCVVSDTFANRNAITHGMSGFVVNSEADVGRYVELLLSNDVLRRRLGQAARAQAIARFGTARFREKLCQLYALADEPVASTVQPERTSVALVS
jgi:glycosyltransferase involved in cell wall biosynthesis